MPDVQKLLNAIDAAEDTAYGSDGDGTLAAERARAIDAYLGKNILPAPEGRSQVVDRSVYETIAWIQPSLSRIFANGDDVVELPPLGPEDEEGAKQEAAYLNYVVTQKNNWFQIFTTWSRDALLTKAGYLLVAKESRTQVELENYERQTREGLAFILRDGAEIVEAKEYPDEDAEPQVDPQTGQPAVDPQTGQPLPPPMLYDVTVRRTKPEVAYVLKPLPPERVKVSERCATVQVLDAPYVEYWDTPTISDLREMGYKIEDDIASDDGGADIEDEARNRYDERTWDEDNPIDPAQRRVRCRWVWIRHDYDEDGVSELQHCVVVGKELLHREEVNCIPIAVLCPDPLPHRHMGLSVADSVMDIQLIKTDMLRQGIDNLRLSNNQRMYVRDGQVNLDDLLVSRPGGIVRGSGIFGQDISPIPMQFMFPQALQGLEYMDSMRENRTGTNRYFTGVDQNALNKTASGIQQLSTMAAQRVEQVARYFANGIETMFHVLHQMVLKGGHQKDVVRLRGNWTQVDPSTWRRRTDFKISVGYSAGNKDAQVSRLMMIANFQREALAGGLPIVQPANVYATAMELTKASDFSAPERFFSDPAQIPPEEPQPDPALQKAQMDAQVTTQVKQAELQQRTQSDAQKMEIEKYKADLDAQTKVTLEQMRLAHEKEVEAFRAQNNVGIEQLRTEQSLSLEERRVMLGREDRQMEQAPALELAGQVESMAQRLEDALQSLQGALSTVLTAKRQIRRGRDGRAEGVDVVGPDGQVLASQSVVRGPDGRVLGTQ